MNTTTLFVAVDLEEGVKPSDVAFTVYSHDFIEEDGFLVSRNGQEDGENKINASNTWVLGRERENINFDDYPLILEIEVTLKENINPDDVRFTVDSAEVDGFEINVVEKPAEHVEECIVDTDETYIASRYIKEEKPVKNKTFIASFNGRYLRGSAVVTAPTREEAYKMVKIELEKQDLGKGFTKSDVYEIDVKKQQVDILYDGELS